MEANISERQSSGTKFESSYLATPLPTAKPVQFWGKVLEASIPVSSLGYPNSCVRVSEHIC